MRKTIRIIILVIFLSSQIIGVNDAYALRQTQEGKSAQVVGDAIGNNIVDRRTFLKQMVSGYLGLYKAVEGFSAISIIESLAGVPKEIDVSFMRPIDMIIRPSLPRMLEGIKGAKDVNLDHFQLSCIIVNNFNEEYARELRETAFMIKTLQEYLSMKARRGERILMPAAREIIAQYRLLSAEKMIAISADEPAALSAYYDMAAIAREDLEKYGRSLANELYSREYKVSRQKSSYESLVPKILELVKKSQLGVVVIGEKDAGLEELLRERWGCSRVEFVDSEEAADEISKAFGEEYLVLTIDTKNKKIINNVMDSELGFENKQITDAVREYLEALSSV